MARSARAPSWRSTVGTDPGDASTPPRGAVERKGSGPTATGSKIVTEPGSGLGFSGAGSEQHFTAYALGKVDDDPEFDCWSISSIDRKSAAGVVIPAGVPHHEKADYEGEQVANESP